MKDNPIKVLLIEDNPTDRMMVGKLLSSVKQRSFELEVTERISEGLDALSARRFDVILLDLNLPDSSGLDSLSSVRANIQHEAIIVLSGLEDENIAVEALRQGAQDYLLKGPINGNLLSRAIRYAVERKKLEEMQKKTNKELENSNLQLEEAIEHANRMASETENVYIELSQIFNTTANGMCVIDKDFKVIRINDMLSNLSGINKEEAVNKKCYEVLSTELCHGPKCPVTRILSGEERVECEIEEESHDGTKTPFILTANALQYPGGEIVGVIINLKEITALKQAEVERLHREKMEGIFEMAGAVCHEMNQPMQAISGYSDLLMNGLKEDDPLHKDMKKIKEQIFRMGVITKKLMGITRYQTREYIKGKKIIDIDGASEQAE